MKRINILDPETIQLIAAGEVTENPACVVKELLENSLDAGATRVTAEIKNGGIKIIKVSDNGHGIYRDDVKDAFSRHATSKIKNKEEIENINSLGFRGEALASIAAVSKTEIVTKSNSEIIGTKITVTGGEFGEISDAGRFIGTDVCVKNLFFNTPARMKFLKKETTEGNKVASVIDKLALSHPEVSFKFIRDGKLCLFSPGDGKISSAVYSVYGKEFLEGTIPLSGSLDGMKIAGLVSKPENCRPSKSLQIFFVNGRLIKSKLISTALEEAFKNSVMVGKSPYCVIYLSIPANLVDVNVHPAKTEVRFADEKAVSELVFSAVKNCLINKNKKDFEKCIPLAKKSENSLSFKDGAAAVQSFENPGVINFFNLQNLLKPSGNKSEKVSLTGKSSLFMNKSLRENFKVVGEVFGCYLILECKNELIFVDKHAAHERIIFEKMKKSSSEYSSQMLLNPVTVTLEKQEYCAVIENLNLFSKSGYEIEDFGPGTVVVRSAPMYEDINDLANSVIEIANCILDNKKSSETKKLEWIYQNIACRSAIKAKSKTSVEELVQLVNDISENPQLRHCPHGRPIYIKFDKSFIAKRFGRI
mgnify:FL=1